MLVLTYFIRKTLKKDISRNLIKINLPAISGKKYLINKTNSGYRQGREGEKYWHINDFDHYCIYVPINRISKIPKI